MRDPSFHRTHLIGSFCPFRRLGALTALLLAVDFLDESYAGAPVLGGAAVQAEFAVSYSVAAAALLAGPQLFSLLLEPPLFVLADRYPRKRFVVGGLFAMGLCALAAAVAPGFALIAVAISLASVASGCGVHLSQATLMDAHPTERERTMARWTLMGSLGDLAAPLLFSAIAALGFGWRGVFVVVAALSMAYAVALGAQRFPERATREQNSSEEEPGLRTALRALRNRRLLAWLFASALCDFLDELLVLFASLYMRDELGMSAAGQSAIIACFALGATIGLVALDRLLARCSPIKLLAMSAAACAVSYLAWLTVTSTAALAVLMALVGVSAAPLYPIATAQAYRALPQASGTVNALGHVFTPVTIASPFLLGLVANQFGMRIALLLLGVQPLVLLGIALLYGRQEIHYRVP